MPVKRSVRSVVFFVVAGVALLGAVACSLIAGHYSSLATAFGTGCTESNCIGDPRVAMENRYLFRGAALLVVAAGSFGAGYWSRRRARP